MIIDKLNFKYNKKSQFIKSELSKNIKSNRTFSLTLDTYTSINQKAFLGITM